MTVRYFLILLNLLAVANIAASAQDIDTPKGCNSALTSEAHDDLSLDSWDLDRVLDFAGEVDEYLNTTLRESTNPETLRQAAINLAALEQWFGQFDEEVMAVVIEEDVPFLSSLKTLGDETVIETENTDNPLDRGITTLPTIPSQVDANTEYFVQPHQGTDFHVRFSSDIVESFFRTTVTLPKRAGEKFVKALTLGFVKSGHGAAGLKSLGGSSNGYELKIIGRHLPYRLIGYFHDGVLYLEFFTDEKDHTNIRYQNTLQTLVQSAKKKHGHN